MTLLRTLKKKINILRGKNRELNKDEIKETFLSKVNSKRIFSIFHDLNIIFTILILTTVISNIKNSSKFFFILIIISICLFALLFLRIYIFNERQVENYELYYNEDLDSLILTFKNYLGKKGTRKDNKKIEILIRRIEKADIHFRNFKNFYVINNIIWVSIIYFIILFFLFTGINVFYINSYQIDFMFYFLMTIIIFNLYFLTIFMIRNYHFKNLQRARYLFELIYTRNLDLTFSELERITFYEKKYESNEKILKLLKEWHKVYYGICPIDNSESEKLIYENRQNTVKDQELEKFYNLFNSLRINISSEIISLKVEDNLKQRLKIMEHLIYFLDNYIELINFKIEDRKKEKQRKKEIRNTFRDFSTIIIAVFTIISLVLSIIK